MFQSTKGLETEVEANTGFESQWNRVQTVLQALIGLVVAAGLAGLFGNGWLSSTTQAFAAQPLSVTYQRLLRANAPTDLVLTVERPLAGESLTVQVGAELLAHASIGSTEPRATAVQATPRGVRYRFDLGPDHQGSVTFRLAPRKVGPVEARLAVEGDALALTLFIYP